MANAQLDAASAPYKEKWNDVLSQKNIKIGALNIELNTTSTNPLILASNAMMRGAASVSSGVGAMFAPASAGTSGQLTGSATDLISRFKLAGTSTVGSVVKNFSSGNIGAGIGGALTAVSTLGGSLGFGPNASNTTAGGTLNIGESLGFSGGAGEAAGKLMSDTAEELGKKTDAASKKVKGYIAPITETLKTLEGIGEEFDKIIKDTFLGQIFKIKGSEILCALFCIIISLLPCAVRQRLYDAVVAIKQGLALANSAIDSINNMTRQPVEVPLFNEKTIADNVQALFSDKLKGKASNKALNVPRGTETRKPIQTLEVPQDVLSILNNIVLVLSILAKGQITLPVGTTGVMWSFAQAVLAIVQMIVVQVVDEFLTKVVKDVEASLKKMIPQMCVGNLAAKFINRIIEAVKALKGFLLECLKMLLGDFNGFGLKWKTFGWYFKELQELLAMLKALQMILKKFPDLVLQCGISPCNDLPSKELQEIQDSIRNGLTINETNMPANILPKDMTPQGKTLDELADTFKSMTGNPDSYAVQAENGFYVIMPDMFQDAPVQIRNLINSPEFLNTLGGAYTLYVDPNSSGINVVYTYELKC
jgi:hypothetical protein